MSTWYRIDRWKYSLGKIDEVECVKETEKTVWIKSTWNPDSDRIDKYAKSSQDYFFFDNEFDAKQRASDMMEAMIKSYKHEIEQLEERMAKLDD